MLRTVCLCPNHCVLSPHGSFLKSTPVEMSSHQGNLLACDQVRRGFLPGGASAHSRSQSELWFKAPLTSCAELDSLCDVAATSSGSSVVSDEKVSLRVFSDMNVEGL